MEKSPSTQTLRLIFSGDVTRVPQEAIDVLSKEGLLMCSKKYAEENFDSCKLRLHLDANRALELCSRSHDTPPPRRHVARALHALLTWLHDVQSWRRGDDGCDEEDVLPAEPDAEEIYARLQEYVDARPRRPSAAMPAQLPELRPTLRQYQVDAVEWMLAREGLAAAATPPGTRSLWHRLRFADGEQCLHWNACNGALAQSLPDGSAGGEYMPRSTCGWIIEPVISKDNPCTACVITLYFREMDLEAPHDYIKVYEALKFQPKNPLLDFELETSRSTMESMLSWIDIETAVPARPSSK